MTATSERSRSVSGLAAERAARRRAGNHGPLKNAHPPGRAADGHRTPDEQRAKGKALRAMVARQDQAHWDPPKGRRDPVDLLRASNKGRLPHLIPIRFGRMMQSPFAFYRGSAALMAADLASTPKSGLIVQACGDAHLMNFGGFSTPERNIIFDINDLDETLPAPWEWDLKRLVASVAIAGRHIRLSESDIARTAIDTVRGYRERMVDYGSMRALDIWYDAISLDKVLKEVADEEDRGRIAQRVEKARARSTPEYLFPKLVEEQGAVPRIADDPPLIFHPTAEQAPQLETGYREGFAMYRESLPEQVRTLFDRFTFADLVVKVVGVGSVGTFCGVALLLAHDGGRLRERGHRLQHRGPDRPRAHPAGAVDLRGPRVGAHVPRPGQPLSRRPCHGSFSLRPVWFPVASMSFTTKLTLGKSVA